MTSFLIFTSVVIIIGLLYVGIVILNSGSVDRPKAEAALLSARARIEMRLIRAWAYIRHVFGSAKE